MSVLRRLREALGRDAEADTASAHTTRYSRISAMVVDTPEYDGAQETSPIRLRSTGFKRSEDGSVTLSVTLDKDQVECCVCLSSMTAVVFRCRAPSGSVCHNVCSDCEWQIRRMKSHNGHTKSPRCPMCKVEGPFIRHKSLERQLLEISQPCRHTSRGCDKRFFPWDTDSIEEHDSMCLFGPVLCPFCDKTIEGGQRDFIEHLQRGKAEARTIRSVSGGKMTEIGPIAEEEDVEQTVADESKAESREDDAVSVSSDDVFSTPPEREEEKTDEIDHCVTDIGDDDISTVSSCTFRFVEQSLQQDSHKNHVFELRRQNTFVIYDRFGFVLVCFGPTTIEPVWKICAVSVSPLHTECGNNRVYITYANAKEQIRYSKVERDLGLLGESLLRPMQGTIVLNMARLTPIFFKDTIFEQKELIETKRAKERQRAADRRTAVVTASMVSDFGESTVSTIDLLEFTETEHIVDSSIAMEDDCDDVSMEMRSESCTPSSSDDAMRDGPFIAKVAGAPQFGTVYAGFKGTSIYHRSLHIRVFTLEESLKVGAILDARDFAGKWYQAEVLKVADADGMECSMLMDTDPLLIRRIKIHYLGYSANYDEWLNVDTDSHRMAQRGTYTVGADLRAVRRHAHAIQPQLGTRVLVRRELADLVAAAHSRHSRGPSSAM